MTARLEKKPAAEADDGRVRPTPSALVYLAEPSRPPKIAWVLAAITVILLHASVAAFFEARYRSADSAPELGMRALDVAVEIAAQPADETDLPPGPAADESAASTAQPEREAKTKDELPKDVPDDNPDAFRQVAPNPSEKATKEPKAVEAPSKAATPSIASEAAAPLPLKTTKRARRSSAPSLGTGETARRVRATWQRELEADLIRHKRYPVGAGGRRAEIVVSFTLDRDGRVLSERVIKGSGDPLFDRAALDMIRRSNPVPPPPPQIADEGLSFTVPVLFEPRARG